MIEVDKTLAGAPVSGQVTVETTGWRQVDGEAETELRGADSVPVSTGASGVFFLCDFEHAGHYGLKPASSGLLKVLRWVGAVSSPNLRRAR